MVVDAVYDAVRERFINHGGYVLSPAERDAVAAVLHAAWEERERAEREALGLAPSLEHGERGASELESA